MLHLNDDGYKLWNGLIKKEISKIIPLNRPGWLEQQIGN